MAAFASRAIPRAVVDAGPLFAALTLHYVRVTRLPEPKRTSVLQSGLQPHLRQSPTRQKACLELFDRIGILLTTSHVIGEIQGLQNSRLKLYGKDQESFWLYTMDFLLQRKLDERLLRLLDMHTRESSRDSVCKAGPTDVGLIELAVKEGCVLLTEDERSLAPLARQNGVDCQLLWTLLP